MKFLYTILIFVTLKSSATIYYVDNAGNDANNGTSMGTAWQTIAKVNASVFSAGDQILLKAGGTWNERLVITSSGAIGNPIIIGSFGTGGKPVITSLQTLTGFTSSGNVWTATATNSVKSLNTVIVGGAIRAKARTPNTGYLTFTSYSGNTQITGNLTGTPNYTGAECVVRSAPWIADVVKITSQSGGTLNLSPGLTYTPQYGGNGYFIQNVASALDVSGEWTFDSTTKTIQVYSTTSPSVSISTIDTLVWLRNKSYITFDGISFQGANKATLQIDTCSNIIVRNCKIDFAGTDGVCALKSAYVSILNDSITNCFNNAIYMRQVDPLTPTVNTCDYATIDGNYIKNTGATAGMGMSGENKYMCISVAGLQPQITNNRIDSSGYIGVYFNGKNSIVKNNYITNFCLTKNDGAAIYTWNLSGYYPANYSDSSVIRSNIVANGSIGAGGIGITPIATGVYMDDGASGVTIDSNTVTNCSSAFYMHNSKNITIIHNNTFKNTLSEFLVFPQSVTVQGLVFKYNKLYNNTSSKIVDATQSNLTVANYGILDNNVYSHPFDETKIYYYGQSVYSLGGWASFSSQDIHSTGTPSGVISTTAILQYNPTLTTQTYALVGLYVGLDGNFYNNSITIPPYYSAILFPASSATPYITGGLSIGKYKLN